MLPFLLSSLMPSSYTIDQERSLIHITMTGKMDIFDALKTIRTFISDPLFKANYGILFDVRETNYLPQYSEVSSFYHEYSELYKDFIKGKVALLVKSKIQYGIGRMSSTIFSGINLNMEVFISEDDAKLWLKE